jgi:hypothetical protein
MRPVLPLAALALGCAGAPPPRPLPASAPAATLDGRSLHPEGLHELVRARYWDAVQAQRDTPAPTGEGLTRNALAAWLRGRVEALRSLHPLIAQLNQRSPDDALFASVLYGRLVDTLSAEVAALPRVAGVSADLEDIWRRALTGAVAPLTRSALDAWRRCATVAPRASLELRAWEPVCTAQAEVLAARLEASPAPAAPPRRPAALAMPTECDGPELRASHVDPEAPPPDLRSPACVGPACGEHPTVARRRCAAPRGRVADAPAAGAHGPGAAVGGGRRRRPFSAPRRWRSDGPVCGQAPPLPALLAARHPQPRAGHGGGVVRHRARGGWQRAGALFVVGVVSARGERQRGGPAPVPQRRREPRWRRGRALVGRGPKPWRRSTVVGHEQPAGRPRGGATRAVSGGGLRGVRPPGCASGPRSTTTATRAPARR